MKSKEKDNIIYIQLFPGENIKEKLNEACLKHDLKTAIILSGIGQIENIKIGYYKKNNYSIKIFEKPLEIISLSGNICKQKKDFFLHLHICLGDENNNAYGGHFIEGYIGVTGEIIILKTDVNINRKIDEESGLQIFDFD